MLDRALLFFRNRPRDIDFFFRVIDIFVTLKFPLCTLQVGEAERSIEETREDSDDEDRMTTVSVHGDPGSHKPFRAIVLVFALSLHSFFEGLAIGLQKNTQDVVQLFGKHSSSDELFSL